MTIAAVLRVWAKRHRDLSRIDVQRRDVKKKLAAAFKASGTMVTEIFGVGPGVAAAVIGDVGDIHRFPTWDRCAAYNGTAPVVEVSSGQPGRLPAVAYAGIGESTTPSTWRRSPRSATRAAKAALTATRR